MIFHLLQPVQEQVVMSRFEHTLLVSAVGLLVGALAFLVWGRISKNEKEIIVIQSNVNQALQETLRIQNLHNEIEKIRPKVHGFESIVTAFRMKIDDIDKRMDELNEGQKEIRNTLNHLMTLWNGSSRERSA